MYWPTSVPAWLPEGVTSSTILYYSDGDKRSSKALWVHMPEIVQASSLIAVETALTLTLLLSAMSTSMSSDLVASLLQTLRGLSLKFEMKFWHAGGCGDQHFSTDDDLVCFTSCYAVVVSWFAQARRCPHTYLKGPPDLGVTPMHF